MKDKMILYSYFRSSASYRVRIALYHKGISFEYAPVHLLKDGGEQFKDEYKKLNPMSQVPSLVHKGEVIGQSMAIIEYLDTISPDKPLFPRDPIQRAHVVQFCEIINSGIQPLQNLQVLAELEKKFQITPEQKVEWTSHWMKKGFTAIETMLNKFSGKYCFGDQVTAADCFLEPQYFAAGRFKYDIAPHKKVIAIHSNLEKLEAFKLAHPQNQPDFQA